MYKIITNIVIFLMCSIFTSCSVGVYHVDLGNQYAWIEGREIVKIKEETSNSFQYEPIVHPQVLNCDSDDKYVIAYQVYDGSEYYFVSAIDENRDSLLLLYSQLKEMRYNYWIIDKETDQAMGPMRKIDFDSKCKELHVKAKMRNFYEVRFDANTGVDSNKRKQLEEMGYVDPDSKEQDINVLKSKYYKFLNSIDENSSSENK